MSRSLSEIYDGFAIDLDGVIWRGEMILQGAKSGVDAIRATNRPILFLTNNGAYSPAKVVERLHSAGIEADEEEVLNSSMVAKQWITQNGLTGQTAFVLANEKVADQLSDVVEIVAVGSGTKASVVVVGRDTAFNFMRLTVASKAIAGGAPFIALNRDATMPVEGAIEPGTGAIVAALEVASGKQATVLGKPELPMMKAASEILGGRVLMIGDRLDSDVLGAHRIGWDAALVSSGSTDPDTKLDPLPEFVFKDISEIAKLL